MLSTAEIEHFALHGYVVKRGVIDHAQLGEAADLVWRHLPASFDRSDPSTWTENVCDCRGDMSLSARFGMVKLRSEIRRSRELHDITIDNPALRALAAQLLGHGNVADIQVPRGIYPIFPTPEHKDVAVSAHLDNTPNPFFLSVGVYLERIPNGGGGLNVWPGSHRTLHHLAESTGCNYEDLATPELEAAFAAWNMTAPVTISGDAGDVILFHYRLAHAPSVNAIPGHVRLAAYFNIYANDQAPQPPDPLWGRWRGVAALRTGVVEQSEPFLPAPSADRFLPSRTNAHMTGAWAGFAQVLSKTVRRKAARRAASQAA